MFGLLSKPFTGAFDSISLTAEGIKNESAVFDDKPNRKRIRKPRAFYSHL